MAAQSVSFSGYGTILTESSGTYFGEFRWVGGTTEAEIFERSFPGSSGIMEVDSGDRRGIYVMRCTWVTEDPRAVDSKMDEIVREKRYGTLSFYSGVSGEYSITDCRLISAIPSGERISGYNAQGDKCIVMSKTLTFKKVRFDEI